HGPKEDVCFFSQGGARAWLPDRSRRGCSTPRHRMVPVPRVRSARWKSGAGVSMIKTAIIAALERELRPLVKGWSRTPLESGGRTLLVYRSGDVIAVAGGIGRRRAELAARAVVEQFCPQILISAGLAGALIRSLKAGSVMTPNVVVDAANGAE